MRVLTVIKFPEGSEVGDRQCIAVKALSDSLTELDEFLLLFIFPLPLETTPYIIDKQQMFASLIIKDSESSHL